MKGTDMKGHLYVSIAKSIIRVLAGVSLLQGNLAMAGIAFISAEFLGIIEEFV